MLGASLNWPNVSVGPYAMAQSCFDTKMTGNPKLDATPLIVEGVRASMKRMVGAHLCRVNLFGQSIPTNVNPTFPFVVGSM